MGDEKIESFCAPDARQQTWEKVIFASAGATFIAAGTFVAFDTILKLGFILLGTIAVIVAFTLKYLYKQIDLYPDRLEAVYLKKTTVIPLENITKIVELSESILIYYNNRDRLYIEDTEFKSTDEKARFLRLLNECRASRQSKP
jgi:hypothetical protein